jgi:hypothetical protein
VLSSFHYSVKQYTCHQLLTFPLRHLQRRLTFLGPTGMQASRSICARFYCQECWYAIYSLSWPRSLSHVHGRLCDHGLWNAESHGRLAEDVETASARVHGCTPCLSTRSDPRYRECFDQVSNGCRPTASAVTEAWAAA